MYFLTKALLPAVLSIGVTAFIVTAFAPAARLLKKTAKTWIILAVTILCATTVVSCAVSPGEDGTGTLEQRTDIPPNDANDKPVSTPEIPIEPEDTVPLTCDHPQFKIAFDSQPTRFTVVDWFYDHGFLSKCASCGRFPFDTYASETAFSDCLEGLKSGKYDVILIPCSSDILSGLDDYTVVPIQRDAVIFVRSNSSEQFGFNLTDEQIRRAYTSEDTVYWDEAQTDPIIPASGGHDGATMWQHISRLFGFSPSSPNVVFIGQGQDNAPMAIADSGRSGSGLWPYYFSCRSGEAALNGEPIAVDGVYPTAQSVADGSYPYTFAYYAVYSPGNAYASEIDEFVSYVRQLKYCLFETSDSLRYLPTANRHLNNRRVSITGIDGNREFDLVVNEILLQVLFSLHDQISLPEDPHALKVFPHGIQIEYSGSYWRQLTLSPCTEFPCVRIKLTGPLSEEPVSVVYSPQLYLYLTALTVQENATLADPDNDGFFEALIWQSGAHDPVIYDYYDDAIHRISTNGTIGCIAKKSVPLKQHAPFTSSIFRSLSAADASLGGDGAAFGQKRQPRKFPSAAVALLF